MRAASLALPLALLTLTLSAPVHANEQLVGHEAYARAQAGSARRSGGFFRYGWHITKGAILYGALGAGAGYFLGGPAAAIDWGTKGAIGGSAWRAATGGSKCGVFKRSGRAVAKADLCEAKGQSIRKHYYKIKGIVWSAVESGVVSGVASGAIGTLFGGPASTIPSAIGGCLRHWPVSALRSRSRFSPGGSPAGEWVKSRPVEPNQRARRARERVLLAGLSGMVLEGFVPTGRRRCQDGFDVASAGIRSGSTGADRRFGAGKRGYGCAGAAIERPEPTTPGRASTAPPVRGMPNRSRAVAVRLRRVCFRQRWY